MPEDKDKDKDNTLDIISEFLDKTIEMQQASTEAMTSLKVVTQDSARNLQEINNQFRNGFRLELKNHLTNELSKHDKPVVELKDEIKELKKTVKSFHDLMAKPGYWVKLIFTTVAATATALGAIVALFCKLIL